MLTQTPLAFRDVAFPDPFDGFLTNVLSGARPSGRTQRASAFPSINAWEDEQNYYVELEVPGVTRDQLDVSFTEGALTVRVQREERTGEGVTVHRRERFSGTYSRSIRFGDQVDADRISASLTNGVLLVTLPKAEQVRPRKIDVAVN